MSPLILIVMADSQFLQNLVSRIGLVQGKIISAANQFEALEISSGRKIDVAVLDIRDQGADSIRLLKSLKKEEPGIEILLLSSPESVPYAMEGMREGASDELMVPFDIRTLREKIQEAVERRKALKKKGRKRSLLDIFEGAMMAATFAQAGEYDSAREIMGRDDDDLRSKEKNPDEQTGGKHG